ALQMARDHPLLGVGLDNFLYLYGDRYVQRDAVQERFLSHPHNAVLDWWTRLGLPGLVLFVAVGAGNLLAGAKAIARACDSRGPAALARGPAWSPWLPLAVGALGMQVYALAHGMVDNVFFLVDLAVVWWIGQAGVLAVLDED
ncbi:MAG: O-antigen ligase family protein, partial [Anaerolineae bacterium]